MKSLFNVHTRLSMLLPMSGSKLSSISSETVMAAAAAKALRRLWADDDPPIESLMAADMILANEE